MPLTNQRVVDHAFFASMYRDDYYPDHVVDKARQILLNLCERIEEVRPADLTGLYGLTHAATEDVNDLESEFAAAGSEIETVAREAIAEEFWFVATAYGFTEVDVEELIAPREW
ncbi:DUF5713 family protein [Nonomuraea typhae]|uniref:DUF5713 family protein n=1 Tax=Nonomuraea typhae TaxID=2603600 RepID=UPI0012FB6F3E|nr:DUF5713 family protein [Nonomuraea typhae]